MLDLVTIRSHIERSWSFDTSYCDDKEEWYNRLPDVDNSFMQCASTTALLDDLYEGEGNIMCGRVDEQPHYWYRVGVHRVDKSGNLCITYMNMDFTWRQFPAGTAITHICEVSKQHMIVNPWMQQRCDNLKANYLKQLQAITN